MIKPLGEECSQNWNWSCLLSRENMVRKLRNDLLFLTFTNFISVQSRMWENMSKGCNCSSQASIQNMCLLLNISTFHKNKMAPSQVKHIPDISQIHVQLSVCLWVRTESHRQAKSVTKTSMANIFFSSSESHSCPTDNYEKVSVTFPCLFGL